MRIAVFGSGGVGGYFGGRLAQAGEDVVFIARGDHLQAMLAQGLRVDSVKGDFLVKPVQATDNPAQTGIMDVVLVGVKAWQVLVAGTRRGGGDKKNGWARDICLAIAKRSGGAHTVGSRIG